MVYPFRDDKEKKTFLIVQNCIWVGQGVTRVLVSKPESQSSRRLYIQPKEI